MSAIAHILLARGYRVSGSDLRASEATRRLAALGATVYLGHDPGHLADVDVVVASRAVPELNVEMVTARHQGLPVHHRAQVLGQILAEGFGIAVVGTHGKTTTAAMTAHVLAAGGLDPTALIGADVEGLDGNVRVGRGRYLVAEVDESDGSLLFVRPSAAVVTSLDTTDHRDYYRTPERLTQTFTEFLAALPADGFAVLCTDHRHVRDLLSRVSARTITYGLTASARYSATLQGLAGRQTRCTIRRDGISLGPIVLNVPGRYNVLNALAATAVALELGLNFAQVAPALESFRGVSRRFAVRGEVGGIMVVDDYAHNPIKVAAVLRAARESWPDRRIIAVFQPHRYTRTQTTYRRFATAFGDCDHLIVTDIYPADEQPIPGVSAALIVDAVRPHRPVTFIAEQARVVKHLLPVLRSGDLVLTLGAGDIWKTAEELVTALKGQESGLPTPPSGARGGARERGNPHADSGRRARTRTKGGARK